MLTEDYSDVAKNFAPGKLVWHYTGFRGLEGILNGNIWASSAYFLNDMQEFRYAVDVALDVLKEENGQRPGEFSADTLSVVEFFRSVDAKSAFVTSFSRKRDDLSQWRAYGGRGPSFAVGFDPRALSNVCAETRFDFVRVVYGRSAIRDVFHEELSRIRENQRRSVEEVRTVVDDENQQLPYTTADFEIIAALMALAAQAKHESFRDEDEWRLVRRISVISEKPRFELKFRESGSLVVPYVEVPLHKPLVKDPTLEKGLPQKVESPIVAVDIGPSPHPEALVHAVEEMTLRKGLKVPVTRSATPFRNW